MIIKVIRTLQHRANTISSNNNILNNELDQVKQAPLCVGIPSGFGTPSSKINHLNPGHVTISLRCLQHHLTQGAKE